MEAVQQDALMHRLNALGYREVRYVNGMLCGIQRYMFTVGVCVDMDETGYAGRFCFDTWQNAYLFLEEWDGKTPPVVGLDGCTAIK